jgi:hypothetical protein
MQMNYTPEQLQAFKAEYAVRRRRHTATVIAFFICVVGFAMLLHAGSPPWLPVAIVVGAAAFDSLWNWRCPACRNSLGGRTSPNFCPACGVPLA